MADVKATGIGYLKKIIQTHPDGIEEKLLAQLTPDEVRLYNTHLPVSWVPLEYVSKVYAVAIPLLYPGDPLHFQTWGKQIAEYDFLGIYRVLVRLMTIPYLIKQTAKLWKTFHKQGEAKVDKKSDKKEAVFYVTDYPELSDCYREILAGYLLGCIRLAGGKNAKIHAQDENPQQWRWMIEWD